MSDAYEHLGWPVSPYTAKTRSYLHWKGLPFVERRPTLFALQTRIKRAVGRAIMPTVRTPDGQWLQDSSAIIDALEARHPQRGITPPGPRQRVAALLLELHGDEWLILPAMHYRWHTPASAAFVIEEFARDGFPSLPRFLSRHTAAHLAERMRRHLPDLGVSPRTIPGIERFTEGLITALERHLSARDYLLGGRPCIGDFALYAPLWAHLYRDPGTTALFDDAPSVRAWFRRLNAAVQPEGHFLPGDEVPETLDPIFRAIFEEQLPWIATLIRAVDLWCARHPGRERLPRTLGIAPFHIGGSAGERSLLTEAQWKAQRPLAAYAALAPPARAEVDRWLDRVGGAEAMQIAPGNPLVRRDFRCVLEG